MVTSINGNNVTWRDNKTGELVTDPHNDLELLMKRIKIDNNIFQNKQEWSFSKKIAPKFDAHIKKSIPFYKEYQWLCSEISDCFCIAEFNGNFTNGLSTTAKLCGVQ